MCSRIPSICLKGGTAISTGHPLDPSGAPTVLALPFHGTWLVENSPARRVPSHGTHAFGTTYAIDFVAVEHGRTATVRDWRTVFGVEPVDRFYAFGRPILAPADGRVVSVHDGEPDHEARRSQLTLVHYALTQASRARRGAGGLAGNHVIIALGPNGPYVSWRTCGPARYACDPVMRSRWARSSVPAATRATRRSRTSTCR